MGQGMTKGMIGYFCLLKQSEEKAEDLSRDPCCLHFEALPSLRCSISPVDPEPSGFSSTRLYNRSECFITSLVC
jgi:hypothetical protein